MSQLIVLALIFAGAVFLDIMTSNSEEKSSYETKEAAAARRNDLLEANALAIIDGLCEKVGNYRFDTCSDTRSDTR